MDKLEWKYFVCEIKIHSLLQLTLKQREIKSE